MTGDVAGALAIINSAVDNYRRQVRLDDFDVEKYVHQARQGEAMALKAVFMVRTGEVAQAQTIITDAKSMLESVVAVADSEPGALELARNVLAAITDAATQILSQERR